jgi:hypothetical protein
VELSARICSSTFVPVKQVLLLVERAGGASSKNLLYCITFVPVKQVLLLVVT